MDALLPAVSGLVALYGAWVLFVLAVLETSFVTGLVVPSGVATSVATVLALEGHGEPASVAAAALAGGALGDTLGFWVGRAGGEALRTGQGRAARTFRRHHRSAAGLLGRHPAYSVTLARLVAFVRTLMPMAAGMSGLSYRRYVGYDLVGVAAWAAMYMGIGLFARESWHRVASIVGVGWACLFAAGGLLLWLRSRFLRRRTPGTGPTGGVEGPETGTPC